MSGPGGETPLLADTAVRRSRSAATGYPGNDLVINAGRYPTGVWDQGPVGVGAVFRRTRSDMRHLKSEVTAVRDAPQASCSHHGDSAPCPT